MYVIGSFAHFLFVAHKEISLVEHYLAFIVGKLFELIDFIWASQHAQR